MHRHPKPGRNRNPSYCIIILVCSNCSYYVVIIINITIYLWYFDWFRLGPLRPGEGSVCTGTLNPDGIGTQIIL